MTTERCTECGESLGLLPRGTLIYLAPIPWGYIWQRSQQITSRLAKITPVVYMQPEPLKALSFGELGRGLRRMRLHLFGRSGQTRPRGLEVVAPALIPLVGNPLAERLNYRLMVGSILRVLSGQTSPRSSRILWCTRPTPFAERLARAAHHALLVYELIDPIPTSHPMARRLAEVDEALIRQADLVICSSEPLMEHTRRLNAQPHLIPNGVDADHFRDGMTKGDRHPLPLASLAGPIVGFHGTIGGWIDFSLVSSLADRFPGVQFVMIGPIEVPRSILPQRPNLHWIGPRAYHDLPAYLSSFAVCFIPFRVDEFTRARNPGKLFEYFATGKPVVSTDLPEVSAFGGLVYVGKDPAGVASAVEAALTEKGRADLIAQRQAVADANTWDRRVARILHLLHSLTDKPSESAEHPP